MAQDYTNQQLEEMVVGKPERANAVFFEKAALNIEKSKEAGRRIYDPTVYVKMTQPGVTDSIAYKATEHDIAAYPEEYAYFMQNRQGTKRSVSVEIIPGLELVHIQELIDYGLSTIEQLATAEVVPAHLEYAKQAAIQLNYVLQEQSHAQQEESIKEDPEERREILTEALPPSDRPEHATGVRRREVPPSQGSGNDQAPEGVRPGGQEQRRPRGLNPVDNWKVDMVWRP
jgi:hypothetical protein